MPLFLTILKINSGTRQYDYPGRLPHLLPPSTKLALSMIKV